MTSPLHEQLKALLDERLLYIDGAMGTMVQRHKLEEADYRGERFTAHPSQLKGNTDLLVLTRPDVIRGVHESYLAAGADILETNSFNANRISQADYGLEPLVYELNVAAAKLADPSVTPYNFLAGPTYSDQLTILLKYMLDQWQADGNTDLPKVAIFHDDSPFGESPLPAAEAFYAVTGVEFVAIPMPRGVNDFTPQLTAAQEFGATHIAIQNVPSPAAQLLQDKAALEMGDVPVFCLNYCANEQLVRLAGAAAEGVIGAIPFTPLSTDVPGMADIREYAAAHDIDLASKSATYVQGWWFAKIMAEAIRRTLDAGDADAGDALTGANIKTALESMDNWETGGMTAPITFTADDHRGQRAVRLYQVQDGVWEQLTDYISAE